MTRENPHRRPITPQEETETLTDICHTCGENLVDPGSGEYQCPMCELGWY